MKYMFVEIEKWKIKVLIDILSRDTKRRLDSKKLFIFIIILLMFYIHLLSSAKPRVRVDCFEWSALGHSIHINAITHLYRDREICILQQIQPIASTFFYEFKKKIILLPEISKKKPRLSSSSNRR